MAFRFDEDEYEWVLCTDAHEINAPIEELPYVLSFYYGGTDELIGSENGYVLCPYHWRLEEVEQRLSHGVRSVCGCEICGFSNHGTFDMSQGRPRPLYIPFRWRLFQSTPDGPLNVAADVAEVRYETKGVSLRWHNFALSAWAARRRWEFTRIRVNGRLQPWTECMDVAIPFEVTDRAVEALAKGVECSCGIRPSVLSRMQGASMLTAYIERPFDLHIVYLKGFLAHAVEDFDETFPYEETSPYRILCQCLDIHPPKSVRRAYTYTPYSITWYMLLRQMGMQEVALMQPFLELSSECDIGEQRISEFYFDPKTRRVESCNSGNRPLWLAMEKHAVWLCRQKGEKALADFLWKHYVWGAMTQYKVDILLNFQRYGAQLTPEVKSLLLREGLTQYVCDAIAWEVEAITAEDEPQRILYEPKILRYECCVNGYAFRLIHHTDELAPIGISLHNCLASYRRRVMEKSSIIVAVCIGERYVACIELDRRCHIVQALGKYNRRLTGRLLAVCRAWAYYMGLHADADDFGEVNEADEASKHFDEVVITSIPYRRAMEEVAPEELETLPEGEIEAGYYRLLGDYLARSAHCIVDAPPWKQFQGEMDYLMYVFPRGERIYRAALGGSVEAARVLGLLYQCGRLMRCDVQRALYWLSWAADHGDGEAALASERLQRAISSGSMERDLAILRGIQDLRRRFPMKT